MTTVLARHSRENASTQLHHGLTVLGLTLSTWQFNQLLEFLALIGKWNRVYSLTALRDEWAGVSIHLLDSLAIAPYISGGRILDVGSGAGFPGIPLAIAKPESQFVLLDSNGKKAAFLRQAVGELSLGNVSVVCERAESWQSECKFDCIVSRAFARLADFVELTEHLLAPSGVLGAMKGAYPRDEIESLPRGFRVRETHRIAVPDLAAERHLVLMERA